MIKPKQIIAFITLAAFTVTSFQNPSAYGQGPEAGENPSASMYQPLEIEKLKVPKTLGRVEEFWKGKTDQTVIILQDAHSNSEAQKKLQKLIQYFQKKFGVSRIGLEGSSGPLDAQIFKSFPDKKKLKQVFREPFKKGELTAGIAAALFSASRTDQTKFFGVEDWPLYEQGLGLYLHAQAQQKETLEKLKPWERSLKTRKQKIYPPQLLEIDRALESFYRKPEDMIQVLQLLASVQKPEAQSEIGILLTEYAGETRLSKDLEAEVKSLAQKYLIFLQKNSQGNAKEMLAIFQEEQQQFLTSEISLQGMAHCLQKHFSALSKEDRLGFPVSKQFEIRAGEQARMDAIEGTQFFKAFQAYAQSVKASLLKSEEARALDREARLYLLSEKLAKLELTREEWDEIKALSGKRTANGVEGTRDGEEWKNFLTPHRLLLRVSRAFYENAELRDEAFLKNLFTPHNSPFTIRHPLNASLLIAGGFHAQGLAQRLKERGISYAVILPALTESPDVSHYHEHMGGNVSWRNYFEIENGRVSVYNAFVRYFRDQLLNRKDARSKMPDAGKNPESGILNPESRLLLKSWRDQIIRDLAQKNQTGKAGNYTKFLDEAVQGESGFEYSRVMERMNRFLDGILKLDRENKISNRSILNLLKPFNITAAASSAAASPRIQVASPYLGFESLPDFRALSISPEHTKSRAETRQVSGEGNKNLLPDIGADKKVSDAITHWIAGDSSSFPYTASNGSKFEFEYSRQLAFDFDFSRAHRIVLYQLSEGKQALENKKEVGIVDFNTHDEVLLVGVSFPDGSFGDKRGFNALATDSEFREKYRGGGISLMRLVMQFARAQRIKAISVLADDLKEERNRFYREHLRMKQTHGYWVRDLRDSSDVSDIKDISITPRSENRKVAAGTEGENGQAFDGSMNSEQMRTSFKAAFRAALKVAHYLRQSKTKAVFISGNEAPMTQALLQKAWTKLFGDTELPILYWIPPSIERMLVDAAQRPSILESVKLFLTTQALVELLPQQAAFLRQLAGGEKSLLLSVTDNYEKKMASLLATVRPLGNLNIQGAFLLAADNFKSPSGESLLVGSYDFSSAKIISVLTSMLDFVEYADEGEAGFHFRKLAEWVGEFSADDKVPTDLTPASILRQHPELEEHEIAPYEAPVSQLPSLLIKNGYKLISTFGRGGSNSNTYLAENKDGRRVVLKYADWAGISGNGTPWLVKQVEKLQHIQKDYPEEAKILYPKVLDFYHEGDIAYYAMEYFEGSADITKYFFYDAFISEEEMTERVDSFVTLMAETHYKHRLEPYPDELEKNVLGRMRYRMGLLKQPQGEVYEKLIKGHPFQVGALKYPDAAYFFDDLMRASHIAIQGRVYPNLPVLLEILETNRGEIEKRLGPTHYASFSHGDIPMRNVLILPDKSTRIIDVRGLNIHETSPSKTSVEYDLSKIAHGFFLEMVRNGHYELTGSRRGDSFEFDYHFFNYPGNLRYQAVRDQFYGMLANNSSLRGVLSAQGSNWQAHVRLGEFSNYAADAIHRFSQDPSGEHPLLYYLEATRGLYEFLKEQNLLPESILTGHPEKSSNRLATGRKNVIEALAAELILKPGLTWAAVSGASGSGKTFFTNKAAKAVTSSGRSTVTVKVRPQNSSTSDYQPTDQRFISMDWFLRDRETRNQILEKVMKGEIPLSKYQALAWDMEGYEAMLREIRDFFQKNPRGASLNYPINGAYNRETGKNDLNVWIEIPWDAVIFVEGVSSVDENTRHYFDKAVMVDLRDEEGFIRAVIERESRKEPEKRTPEGALRQRLEAIDIPRGRYLRFFTRQLYDYWIDNTDHKKPFLSSLYSAAGDGTGKVPQPPEVSRSENRSEGELYQRHELSVKGDESFYEVNENYTRVGKSGGDNFYIVAAADRGKEIEFGIPQDALSKKRVIYLPKKNLYYGYDTAVTLYLMLQNKNRILGHTVVDFGHGTDGIVTLAAFLLGAERVIAIENEENYEPTFRESMTENRIPENFYTQKIGLFSQFIPALEKELKEDTRPTFISNQFQGVTLSLYLELLRLKNVNPFFIAAGARFTNDVISPDSDPEELVRRTFSPGFHEAAAKFLTDIHLYTFPTFLLRESATALAFTAEKRPAAQLKVVSSSADLNFNGDEEIKKIWDQSVQMNLELARFSLLLGELTEQHGTLEEFPREELQRLNHLIDFQGDEKWLRYQIGFITLNSRIDVSNSPERKNYLYNLFMIAAFQRSGRGIETIYGEEHEEAIKSIFHDEKKQQLISEIFGEARRGIAFEHERLLRKAMEIDASGELKTELSFLLRGILPAMRTPFHEIAKLLFSELAVPAKVLLVPGYESLFEVSFLKNPARYFEALSPIESENDLRNYGGIGLPNQAIGASPMLPGDNPRQFESAKVKRLTLAGGQTVFIKRVNPLRVRFPEEEITEAIRAEKALQAADSRFHAQKFMGIIHDQGSFYLISLAAPASSGNSETSRLIETDFSAIEKVLGDINITEPSGPLRRKEIFQSEENGNQHYTVLDFETFPYTFESLRSEDPGSAASAPKPSKESLDAFFREVGEAQKTLSGDFTRVEFSYEFKTEGEVRGHFGVPLGQAPEQDLRGIFSIYRERGFMVGTETYEAPRKTQFWVNPDSINFKFTALLEMMSRNINVRSDVYEARDNQAVQNFLAQQSGLPAPETQAIAGVNQSSPWQNLIEAYQKIDLQRFRSETRQLTPVGNRSELRSERTRKFSVRDVFREVLIVGIMAGVFGLFVSQVYLPYLKPLEELSPLHLIWGMGILSLFKSAIGGYLGLKTARFLGKTKSQSENFRLWRAQILMSLMFGLPIFGFAIYSWLIEYIPAVGIFPEPVVRAILHQGFLAPILYDPMNYLIGKMVFFGKSYKEVIQDKKMPSNILNYTVLAFAVWFPFNWLILSVEDLSWRFILSQFLGFAWGVVYFVMMSIHDLGFLRSLGIARGKTFEEKQQPLNPLYWLYQLYKKPRYGLAVLSLTYALYIADIGRMFYLFELRWIPWIWMGAGLSAIPWAAALSRSWNLGVPDTNKETPPADPTSSTELRVLSARSESRPEQPQEKWYGMRDFVSRAAAWMALGMFLLHLSEQELWSFSFWVSAGAGGAGFLVYSAMQDREWSPTPREALLIIPFVLILAPMGLLMYAAVMIKDWVDARGLAFIGVWNRFFDDSVFSSTYRDPEVISFIKKNSSIFPELTQLLNPTLDDIPPAGYDFFGYGDADGGAAWEDNSGQELSDDFMVKLEAINREGIPALKTEAEIIQMIFRVPFDNDSLMNYLRIKMNAANDTDLLNAFDALTETWEKIKREHSDGQEHRSEQRVSIPVKRITAGQANEALKSLTPRLVKYFFDGEMPEKERNLLARRSERVIQALGATAFAGSVRESVLAEWESRRVKKSRTSKVSGAFKLRVNESLAEAFQAQVLGNFMRAYDAQNIHPSLATAFHRPGEESILKEVLNQESVKRFLTLGLMSKEMKPFAVPGLNLQTVGISQVGGRENLATDNSLVAILAGDGAEIPEQRYAYKVQQTGQTFQGEPFFDTSMALVDLLAAAVTSSLEGVHSREDLKSQNIQKRVKAELLSRLFGEGFLRSQIPDGLFTFNENGHLMTNRGLLMNLMTKAFAARKMEISA